MHDGVLDLIRTQLIEGGSMTGGRILALELSPGEGVDIDQPEDLAAAEAALMAPRRG